MTADAAELVLSVQRAPADAGEAGAGGRARFTAAGGTVGRSSGCDLAIPDPSHLVSRQHFEVAFENGAFVAIDTSANGLFVNGAAVPVGQGNRVRLNEGDRLGAGDYVLLVERVARSGAASVAARGGKTGAPPEATLSGNPFAEPPPGRGEGPSGGGPSGGGPGGVDGGAPADGLPDLPDFDDALAGSGGAVARDPFGLPEGEAEDPFADLSRSEAGRWDSPAAPSIGGEDPDEGPLIPEDYDPLADFQSGPLDATPARDPGPPQQDHAPAWRAALSDVMGTPRAPADQAPAEGTAPNQPAPNQPAPNQPADGPGTPAQSAAGAGDAQAALAAFCRGAGIDPDELGAEAPEAALERAGSVVRALGHGTADLLQARGAFKQEFRVQRTMLGAADNNPLKFAPDRDTALVHLLRPSARGYMTGPRAVDQAFDDMKQHEMALVAAMHRALAHVLEEFEPSNLEGRLQGMSLRDVLPGGRRARYWDLYCEHYGRIAKSAEDIFEGALGREFVKAYEDATRDR